MLQRIRTKFKSLATAHVNLERRTGSQEAGFTLIEVLIVLAIIGMVASLVGPRVLGYLSDSKIKAAHIQMDAIGNALDLYYLDAGRYPTSTEGLAALVKKPPSATVWNGPYLRTGDVPLDPWGNPYQYHIPGKASPFDLISFGPDGHEGPQSLINHAK